MRLARVRQRDGRGVEQFVGGLLVRGARVSVADVQFDIRIENCAAIVRILHEDAEIGKSGLRRAEDGDQEWAGLLAEQNRTAVGKEPCRGQDK